MRKVKGGQGIGELGVVTGRWGEKESRERQREWKEREEDMNCLFL